MIYRKFVWIFAMLLAAPLWMFVATNVYVFSFMGYGRYASDFKPYELDVPKVSLVFRWLRKGDFPSWVYFGALPVVFLVSWFLLKKFNEDRKRNYLVIVFGIVFSYVFSLWLLATIEFAWNVSPWPYFNTVWFRFFPPFALFEWIQKDFIGARNAGLIALGSWTLVLTGIGVLINDGKVGGDLGANALHGGARWGSSWAARKAGLFSKTGVCLGILGGRELRDGGDSHTLLVAPTRTGKGVGVILPTLLSWENSVVVLDVKDECYQLTSGWRASQGQQIFRFAPSTNENTSRWNPLDEIREGERATEDAQQIAEILVDPSGGQSDDRDHWGKSAYDLLTGAILHCRFRENDKTIHGVSKLISGQLDEQKFWKRMEAMAQADQKKDEPDWEHAIWKTISDLKAKEETPKLRESVIDSARALLGAWNGSLLRNNTSCSDFCLKDIADGVAPASLYIHCPATKINRYRVVLRMLVSMLISRYTEELGYQEGRSERKHAFPLLLMLDEFATLGRMNVVEEGLSYFAGFGIKACIVVQDLAQLRKNYGREEVLSRNCGVRVFFTPSDFEQADKLSKALGTQTVQKHSSSRSISLNWADSLNKTGESTTTMARALMNPDEILKMDGKKSIIFLDGQSPIKAKKIRYYENKTYSERSKMEPSRAFRKKEKKDALVEVVVEKEKPKKANEPKKPQVNEDGKMEFGFEETKEGSRHFDGLN